MGKCVCAYMCICVCVCACACHVHVCAYMCVCVCVCACHVHVCVRVRMCVCMCVSCMCVCVCVHLYLFIHVCATYMNVHAVVWAGYLWDTFGLISSVTIATGHRVCSLGWHTRQVAFEVQSLWQEAQKNLCNSGGYYWSVAGWLIE